MCLLPRGITGYGIDNPPGEVEERREAFVKWARALATANDSALIELPLVEPWPSFDAVRLERLDRWLLHNRHVPVVGVLAVAPEPGPSWAAAGEFVDVDVPAHALGWGPRRLGASELNAALTPAALGKLPAAARKQADRYKPQTVGHVIYNYWS